METFFILVIVLLILGNSFILWFFLKKPKKEDTSRDTLLLQQQIQDLTRTMRESSNIQFQESRELVQGINKEVNEQLRNVVRQVTEVSESSKQVFSIAEQLQNLEKVLKHQKQRGNLGEASLQLIIENMLPPTSYKLQYQFAGGDTVDAVILTKDGMIPVDAKFSLDNYRRLVDETNEVQRIELEKEFQKDLKKRIEETAKYIRPKDNTLPFAFMYIPAEAIYYDLLVNEVGAVKVNTRSLIDYAYKDKNVIIVSPTTFAAYLQTVLYGFRAFKIEESAKQIGKQVESLSRHLRAYDEYFAKLGNALGTTVNHFNTAQKELGKIEKDVLKITGDSPEFEKLTLEKPTENKD
ncbi:MAG: hypothetical protein UV60_C0001G0026 [Parcubacteria group bacterium GW2011_GWA2_43_11]|nr:MAG: hypothetical protein UU89_C0006G0027 [Parcubacteria group bacterium GW2011_GWC2_42_11]KKS86427.1 MAG: hypothetical protein UV60_C0001G0026 [Parcubacteria group bacterium GW2011_GWA2_43_11]